MNWNELIDTAFKSIPEQYELNQLFISWLYNAAFDVYYLYETHLYLYVCIKIITFFCKLLTFNRTGSTYLYFSIILYVEQASFMLAVL